MSSPSTKSLPLVGFSSATMWRSSVVLPAPEPPMITTVSLRLATKLMPLSTQSSSLNFFLISSRTTMSSDVGATISPVVAP
jgi:hypothetical protein